MHETCMFVAVGKCWSYSLTCGDDDCLVQNPEYVAEDYELPQLKADHIHIDILYRDLRTNDIPQSTAMSLASLP